MTDASAPRRREPPFNVPGVIVVCCVVLLGIHAARGLLSDEADNRLVAALAFVPARLSIALHVFSKQLQTAYGSMVVHDPIAAAQTDFLLGDGHAQPWTLLTYAFLHASWAHVGLNCVWLVAFGSAVARRFTAARFMLLLIVAALVGALVQYAANPTSFALVIGASAAVSGAMGSAVRFVFRPDEEPQRMFDRRALNEAFRQPALSLRQTFTTKTALIFIVFWFVTDLLFGIFPALGGVSNAAIAWQAHIGGFLAGLLLFPVFDRSLPTAQTEPAVQARSEEDPTRNETGEI